MSMIFASADPHFGFVVADRQIYSRNVDTGESTFELVDTKVLPLRGGWFAQTGNSTVGMSVYAEVREMAAESPRLFDAITRHHRARAAAMDAQIPGTDTTSTYIILAGSMGPARIIPRAVPGGRQPAGNRFLTSPPGLDPGAKLLELRFRRDEAASRSPWDQLRAAGRFFSAVAAATPYVSEEITVGMLERGDGKRSLQRFFLQTSGAELGQMTDAAINARMAPPPRIEITRSAGVAR